MCYLFMHFWEVCFNLKLICANSCHLSKMIGDYTDYLFSYSLGPKISNLVYLLFSFSWACRQWILITKLCFCSYISFYTPDRLVECSALKRAIEIVYTATLPKASKPFIYMSIVLPSEHVDVNVHPTKREVGVSVSLFPILCCLWGLPNVTSNVMGNFFLNKSLKKKKRKEAPTGLLNNWQKVQLVWFFLQEY